MNPKILVIEDDFDISQLLKKFLSRHNLDVVIANNGKKGIETFKAENPALVLTDFRLGDVDGIHVLKEIKNINHNVPVIIITGYSDVRVAVQAMRLGAYDYVTKPLFPDEILLTIKRALEGGTTDSDKPNTSLPKTFKPQKFIFGKSFQSLALMKQVDLVAPTNYSVIIYGESGAGKEAVAQMIHQKSSRASQPFVAMDCGAISKELAGSELFGHEKGSFTGAMQTKIGHFELANGGTLFLDEVANLPYEVQTSLLRVVQEKKIRRIGSNKEIHIDVRLIIASNENLNEAYHKGKFREDLFHRFNEFQLNVPPLRERAEDIMMYAEFFLQNSNEVLDKNITGFDDEVTQLFHQYPWHGNLRELKNVIKRAALLSDGDRIKVQSLPFEISHFTKLSFPDAEANTNGRFVDAAEHASYQPPHQLHPNLKAAAKEAEYETILRVLKEVNFNKSKAAKILNIDRKTLYNKIKDFTP
ncbi:MAG: sigma-54 dependent transcriptional regulator [Bacteroidota bacterium]